MREFTRFEYLACLLLAASLLLGCDVNEKQSSRAVAATNQGRNEATKARFSVASRSHVPPYLPSIEELPADAERLFVLRELRLDNVEHYIKEINRQGIRRIGLTGRRQGHWIMPPSDLEQPEILRRIIRSCPRLTAISIEEWKMSRADLAEILRSQSHICEIELRVCNLMDEVPTESPTFSESQLRELTVYHCYGLDDEDVAALLAVCPALETLEVRDTRSAGRPLANVFTGSGWPLNRLMKLRRFTMSGGSSDEFVSRVLRDSPCLESLTLSSCREVTGSGWAENNTNQIKELSLRSCSSILDSNLQPLLSQAPELTTLRVSGQELGKLGLSRLSKLRTVELSGCHLTESSIQDCLESWSDLESLIVSGIPNLSGQKIDFSKLTKLKSLELSSCSVHADALATVPSSLESLKLQWVSVPSSGISELLKRLPNLHTLRINVGLQGPDAIDALDWRFDSLKSLKEFDIGGCKRIVDDVIGRIAEQVPSLETLRLTGQYELTGTGWNLEQHPNLKTLELADLQKLNSNLFNHLPSTLKTLRVTKCPINGRGWNLSSYPLLSDLAIVSVETLTSIGANLPPNLQSLNIYACRLFTGDELDYASFMNMETLSFEECHAFNVDRLLAEVPRYAKGLRYLNLTACREPSTGTWDMTPLGDSIELITYQEGDPSYFGGIEDETAKKLQRQLPESRIVN